MHVLVTGGAGYIGSHTVVRLVDQGHQVTVADNFSNAKRAVMARLEQITGTSIGLAVLDVADVAATDKLFAGQSFDAVIHFAGYKAVGESVQKPVEYYQNNLGSTLSLVQAMQAHGVRTLVFSSSATVYGPEAPVPMNEKLPTSATNPYGWTKVMIEQILRDVAVTDPGWRIALLRYFNPVGAHPSGLIGEDPADIPNNLMPFIAQVAIGRREKLQVFGDDYDTVDGTGVRDYIHVEDLAAGHVAALNRLTTTEATLSTWNLGTGRGTSVLELLQAFERACGRTLPYQIVPRRAGDVAVSFADPAAAESDLGWLAEKSVDEMCADAWRWQSRNPTGYPDD